MAKPKPKSDIKFVLNELLTLNMLDNSEKLLNFASITVTLLIVVLLLFSDYKDTTFYWETVIPTPLIGVENFRYLISLQ